MKKIKYLLFISLFIFPLTVFAATTANTSFDSDRCVLTVSGSFDANDAFDAQVNLFSSDATPKFLGLKTGEINNGNYSVEYVLTYEEETTINVSVADQLGNNRVTKNDVVIPACDLPEQSNPNQPDPGDGRTPTIDDGHGVFVTMKDPSSEARFDDTDWLETETYDMDGILETLSQLEGTENYASVKAVFDAIMAELGDYRTFALFLEINFKNDQGENRYLGGYDGGYTLSIPVSKDEYEAYSGLKIALFDMDTLKLGSELKYSYNENDELLVIEFDEPGVFIFYIDDDYIFLDKTADQVYNLGKDGTLTIRVDADFAKFKDVFVDGKLLAKSNYSAKSGSTIITFTKEYLESLSIGEHKVVVHFADGKAETKIIVKDTRPIIEQLLDPNNTNDTDNSKTGDMILTFFGLAAISGTAIVILNAKKKKRLN